MPPTASILYLNTPTQHHPTLSSSDRGPLAQIRMQKRNSSSSVTLPWSSDPSSISSLRTATTSPPASLTLPRPLRLPPRLPFLVLPDQIPHKSGMPKTEIIVIVSVIVFGLITGIAVILLRKFSWKKLRMDGLALLTLCPSRRRSKQRIASPAEKMAIKSILISSSPTSCQQPPGVSSTSEKSMCDTLGVLHTDISTASRSTLLEQTFMYSRPSLQTIQEQFDERCHTEETDIALALQFALREQSPPVVITDSDHPSTSPFITPFEIDDLFAKLSIRAGIESASKRIGLTRNLPTSCSEEVSDALSTKGSYDTMFPDEEQDQEDKDNEEDDLIQLSTAQTRNVEMKKGRLMACTSCDSLIQAQKEISKMPTVIISRASPIDRCPYLPRSIASSESSIADILQPSLPSLVITSPSFNSVGSMTSSVSGGSVDLNDFPIPPFRPTETITNPMCTEVDDLPLFHEQDLEAWNIDVDKVVTSHAEERRSTLMQLVMMYTSA